jgi:hypothetical protein
VSKNIAPDVKLGRDVRSDFVNLRLRIGDESKIGTFVEIQKARASAAASRSRVTLSSAKA